MAWIKVCPAEALTESTFRVVENEDGDEILVARVGDEVFAVANECSHDRRGFEGGCVEDGQIVCPRHGARFCLKTGAVKAPPAYLDIDVYPVRIEDQWIEVEEEPL